MVSKGFVLWELFHRINSRKCGSSNSNHHRDAHLSAHEKSPGTPERRLILVKSLIKQINYQKSRGVVEVETYLCKSDEVFVSVVFWPIVIKNLLSHVDLPKRNEK
jgi:hypothetical protein